MNETPTKYRVSGRSNGSEEIERNAITQYILQYFRASLISFRRLQMDWERNDSVLVPSKNSSLSVFHSL